MVVSDDTETINKPVETDDTLKAAAAATQKPQQTQKAPRIPPKEQQQPPERSVVPTSSAVPDTAVAVDMKEQGTAEDTHVLSPKRDTDDAAAAPSSANLDSFVIKKKQKVDDDADIIYLEDEPPPPPEDEDEQAGIHNKTILLHADWCPASMVTANADNANDPNLFLKSFQLPNFAFASDNTIGVTLSVPSDCKRWSLNLCPPDTKDNMNVLMHFNPRMVNKEVVMTDRQGTWGMYVLTVNDEQVITFIFNSCYLVCQEFEEEVARRNVDWVY
jgi:hypothetical protein